MTLKEILENYLTYTKDELESKPEITNGQLSYLYGWVTSARNLKILSEPGYAVALLMMMKFSGEEKITPARYIDIIKSTIQMSEEFGNL